MGPSVTKSVSFLCFKAEFFCVTRTHEITINANLLKIGDILFLFVSSLILASILHLAQSVIQEEGILEYHT